MTAIRVFLWTSIYKANFTDHQGGLDLHNPIVYERTCRSPDGNGRQGISKVCCVHCIWGFYDTLSEISWSQLTVMSIKPWSAISLMCVPVVTSWQLSLGMFSLINVQLIVSSRSSLLTVNQLTRCRHPPPRCQQVVISHVITVAKIGLWLWILYEVRIETAID